MTRAARCQVIRHRDASVINSVSSSIMLRIDISHLLPQTVDEQIHPRTSTVRPQPRIDAHFPRIGATRHPLRNITHAPCASLQSSLAHTLHATSRAHRQSFFDPFIPSLGSITPGSRASSTRHNHFVRLLEVTFNLHMPVLVKTRLTALFQ